MSARVWKWRCCFLLFLLAARSSPGLGQHFHRDKNLERYSTRLGNVIQLHPTGVSFQIPETWIGPDTFFYLTRHEMAKASTNQWGASIADAVLKVRDCATQIQPGNLTWFRAYVVDWSEEQTLRRIRQKGRAAVVKMPNYAPGHILRGFATEPVREGSWVHVDVPFGLNFGDYTSGGAVSFYIQSLATKELVIVVSQFGSGSLDVRDLLKSITIPNA